MTEKEFVAWWTNKLWSGGIKIFPDDFKKPAELKEVSLPGKALVIGEEFFGAFEILTVDGNQVYQAGNHNEAKYIIYANRLKPAAVKVPLNDQEIKATNSLYEKYLDSIIKEIENDYKIKFPLSKNFNMIANEIFRILNLTRY